MEPLINLFICFSYLVKKLLFENSPIQNALVLALGEMARQGPLPLPAGTEDSGDKDVTLLALVQTLVKIFNNKKLPSKVS